VLVDDGPGKDALGSPSVLPVACGWVRVEERVDARVGSPDAERPPRRVVVGRRRTAFPFGIVGSSAIDGVAVASGEISQTKIVV